MAINWTDLVVEVRLRASRQISEFRAGDISLNELAWGLEDLVIALENEGWEEAEVLRGIWFDIEILNALNLDSGDIPDPGTVDELLEKYLTCLQ